MPRSHNTNKSGAAWTQAEINAVWQKGTPIVGFPSNLWRRDKCQFNMAYNDHGNRQSDNGWEIDHIKAVANGGGDNIENLQPLNWKNNADKSDKQNWTCPH